MKWFVIIAVILLLAVLLAKPMHTTARNVIRRIKSYITDTQGRIMDDLVYYNFQGHSVELGKGDRLLLPMSVWDEYVRVAICMPETDFFAEMAESTEYCFVAEEDGRYWVLAEDSKGRIKNITEEAKIERRGADDADKIEHTVVQTYEKSDKEGIMFSGMEESFFSRNAENHYSVEEVRLVEMIY